MELLASYNTPFAVSLLLLALLLILQFIGIGGFEVDLDTDVDIDGADGADLLGGLASLIGLDRLPFIAWLSIFLACFGLIGLTGQQFLAASFGSPLPALLAGLAAFAGALPVTAIVARPLSYIWPQDETTAIRPDELVGKRGAIAIGTARRDSPARAQVKDRFGQMHNVMVEPHEEQASFAAGDEILLVRRDGDIFYAISGSGPFRLGS